jgi:anaerobic ribonucleoside-triphosphate reductase
MSKNIKVPVEVYSRVVGYFRPVQAWNNGKAEEFKERKTLIIPENIRRKEITI